MDSLLTLLPNCKRAGLFRSAIATDEIVAAAKTAGLQAYQIDLGKARSKNQLLDAFANALDFPEQFGKNWDALNDCLSDLQWLDGKGRVVILANCQAFATSHEEDFATLLELLEGVTVSWKDDGKPFWVFVQKQSGWCADLPEIQRDTD